MADPLRVDELLIGRQPPLSPQRSAGPAGQAQAGQSFAELLRQAQQAGPGALKFSAHAQTRIQSRQIPVGAPEMQRLDGAVARAASKGARESLVLLDQTAFVVSVTNRTVITVVDQDNLKQNVFTNIDSAVIA